MSGSRNCFQPLYQSQAWLNTGVPKAGRMPASPGGNPLYAGKRFTMKICLRANSLKTEKSRDTLVSFLGKEKPRHSSLIPGCPDSSFLILSVTLGVLILYLILYFPDSLSS